MKQSRYLSVFDPVVTGIRDFIPRGSLSRGTLWFDPILNKEYEEYIISEIDEEKDFEIYQFRRDQWQNLVTVHYVSINNFLDSNQVKVFIQRIPILLSQIPRIGFNQFLFILKQSLIGFQTIKQRYGFIRVKDDMIGVNFLGKIKVWLNSKFQNNNPQSPLHYQFHDTQCQQEQMVMSLFDSIEIHCELNQQLLKFRQMKPYKMNFSTANNYIYNFVLQQHITIPQTIVLSECSPIKRSKYEKQLYSQKLSSENFIITSSQHVLQSFQSNVDKSGGYISSKLFSQQNNNSNDKTMTGIKFLTSSVQQVESNWHSKNTKYFRQQGQLFINKDYVGTKSKETMTIKSSWTSKDFSFRSTNTSMRKKNERMCFLEDREFYKQQRKYFPPSRDQSFMNDSHIPNITINSSTQRTHFQHYPIISNQIEITKSVMINQRQHQCYQNPQLSKTRSNKKSLKINTDYGFMVECNNILNTQTPKKFKKFSSMNQLKTLNRSVIKNTDKIQQNESKPFIKNGLLAITKLKSSYFNKLDDLKKSIISQHINQASEADPYSPLIIKTRASAIRKGKISPFFHLTRCNQQQSMPTIITLQQNYFNSSQISHRNCINNNKLSTQITNMHQITKL